MITPRSLWDGFLNHGHRHGREVGKPLMAGYAAGIVVQADSGGLEMGVQISLLFIFLVIFYEVFEQLYERPLQYQDDDSDDVSGPAS